MQHGNPCLTSAFLIHPVKTYHTDSQMFWTVLISPDEAQCQIWLQGLMNDAAKFYYMQATRNIET